MGMPTCLGTPSRPQIDFVARRHSARIPLAGGSVVQRNPAAGLIRAPHKPGLGDPAGPLSPQRRASTPSQIDPTLCDGRNPLPSTVLIALGYARWCYTSPDIAAFVAPIVTLCAHPLPRLPIGAADSATHRRSPLPAERVRSRRCRGLSHGALVLLFAGRSREWQNRAMGRRTHRRCAPWRMRWRAGAQPPRFHPPRRRARPDRLGDRRDPGGVRQRVGKSDGRIGHWGSRPRHRCRGSARPALRDAFGGRSAAARRSAAAAAR